MLGDAVWAAIAAAALVWELVSTRLYEEGALSGIVERIARIRGGRGLLFVGWLWLGWHFLIRYNPKVPG